jgi:hypothetical protein
MNKPGKPPVSSVLRSRAGADPAPSTRGAPSAQQALVSRSDLGVLAEALKVLETLNNPMVSPAQLAYTVSLMPKLSARVAREYHRVFLERAIPPLVDQLKALGNKRFEELLFSYLEDLTIAHGSDQDL